jgi:hypothetical protein
LIIEPSRYFQMKVEFEDHEKIIAKLDAAISDNEEKEENDEWLHHPICVPDDWIPGETLTIMAHPNVHWIRRRAGIGERQRIPL